MFKLPIGQVMVLTVLVLILSVFGQLNHAISALLGGLVYMIPTFLAVCVMSVLRAYPQWAGAAFIWSAGLKLILAIALMISVFVFYTKLHFLSFFVGLLAVSHLVFLLFLKVWHYGR